METTWTFSKHPKALYSDCSERLSLQRPSLTIATSTTSTRSRLTTSPQDRTKKSDKSQCSERSQSNHRRPNEDPNHQHKIESIVAIFDWPSNQPRWLWFENPHRSNGSDQQWQTMASLVWEFHSTTWSHRRTQLCVHHLQRSRDPMG